MKKISFLVLSSIIFFLSQVNAQEWAPSGAFPNNDINRTGVTGIGFANAAAASTAANGRTRFLVNGTGNDGGILAHYISGGVGLFNGKWSGLGEGNPGNFPGVPNPYGLSIADNNNVGFFNLFPRPNTTITRDLVVGFGEAGANANTNRFILRSYFGPSASIQKDLLITNPSGATGINAEPLSTFWVDAAQDDDPNRPKTIAIIDQQVYSTINGPQVQERTRASSGMGAQANASLANAGIVVEGFRAQIGQFGPPPPPGINNDPEVGINVQAVKSPYGGPNAAAIDVVSALNVNGTNEYAELTWQDLDMSAAAPAFIDLTDCANNPLADVQSWAKFFISFRNDNPNNPFAQPNKLPVMTFQGNGRVGIGTLQPTSGTCAKPVLLDVNGQILSGGSLVSSDRRFKQDIQPIDDAMKMVRQLQGTTYTYRKAEFPDRNFAGGNQYGFIAQDVEKVMPEAAFENSDGYYVMNYTVLIPLLTEAIKEQDAVAAQQQVRLTALEQELAELRSQFNDLKAGQQPGDLQGYRLEQNTPNPFGQSTVIGYSIPANVNNAMIRVYDLTGRMLRSFTLSAGEGTVTIQAGELSDGLYIYDLSVGGRQILERKMSVVRN